MRMPALTVATTLLCVVIVVGCGRNDSGDVLARVNQREITQHQLWDYLEKDDDGAMARRALDSLIVYQLMRQEAEKRGIKVSREEIEARVEGMKDYVLANTGKEFEGWLADTGQTEEDVMNQVSRHILTAKLVLTTEDREAYFEAHKDELRELPHNSESVIFRQIVVGSEEEADAIYAELTSTDGADFVAVAEQRSIDPMTRARGGMTGWLIRGKTDDPGLEDALFTLEPGEVSRPLSVPMPTPESEDEEDAQPAPAPRFWRIVRVEKRLPPREITLEDNLDIIEDRMLSEPQFQMQLNQFLSNLRARADVEVLSPRYKVVDELYRREREAREERLSASGAVMPGAAPIAPELPEPDSPPSGPEGTQPDAAPE